MRYLSRQHQRLMDESEHALSQRARQERDHDSGVSRRILDDHKTHRLWEQAHARLVLPIAEQRKRERQLRELRRLEVGLVHRRALIEHIRLASVRGVERDRLFKNFYGPLDITEAILTEHRGYTLAVGSAVSADHLVDLMGDPVSDRLLTLYRSAYQDYFSNYCAVVAHPDAAFAEAAQELMLQSKRRVLKLRRRVLTASSEGDGSDLQRGLLLQRSGRYPALDYVR